MSLAGYCAVAQQTAASPEGSNWQHVKALAVSTGIHVDAPKRHVLCNVKSVDDSNLVCTHGSREIVFARSEIMTIKLAQQARSTLIGGAVGAGAGAGIGVAVAQSASNGFFRDDKGKGAAIGIGIGAAVGVPIGYFSDLSRGPTIYRAP